MRAFLIVLGVLAALLGFDAYMSATNAVGEIEALIAFVAMVIAFGCVGVIGAIQKQSRPMPSGQASDGIDDAIAAGIADANEK